MQGVAKFRQAGRLWVAVLTLFAFLAQAHLAQTHIHMSVPGGAELAGGKASPAPAEAPGKHDPAHCPACLASVHAGAFITPSAAALLLPVQSFQIIALVLEAPLILRALSHDWQSRGPPVS